MIVFVELSTPSKGSRQVKDFKCIHPQKKSVREEKKGKRNEEVSNNWSPEVAKTPVQSSPAVLGDLDKTQVVGSEEQCSTSRDSVEPSFKFVAFFSGSIIYNGL